MTDDPWTDPDPQPGDFDAEIRGPERVDAQVVEAGSDAKLRIVVNVEGEDAVRLERLATARGQGVDEVVSALLRSA